MHDITQQLLQRFPETSSIRLVDQVEKAGKRNYSGKVIWKTEGVLPPSECHVKEVTTTISSSTKAFNNSIFQGNCSYLINLTNGLSTGLFHEQAGSREIVPFLVPKGSTMLNLFAYTCAFSVAAAQENQLKTTNVGTLAICTSIYTNKMHVTDHVFV
jgi:23S rRNA G2069 N7-methylase RlmK/C1962 C5-methylase RlmI